MKRLIIFLLSVTILFCSCTPAQTDKSTTPSDMSTSDITAIDNTKEQIEPWQPDFTKNYNFSLVPSKDYGALPEDYDLVLSLDNDTFSVSNIPEKINLTVVNQTEKNFHMCTTVHLEKLYSVSMELEEEHIDIDYNMGKGWSRVPFTTNEKVSWGITARADVTYPISLETNLKENFELTPGEYRFVLYSAVGSHYAYFEITE
ncbi:MAG: hypothetical protein IJ489_04680 [Clostridia bacterium]|nr:hypothetical protein [Clostridia bacterium]